MADCLIDRASAIPDDCPLGLILGAEQLPLQCWVGLPELAQPVQADAVGRLQGQVALLVEQPAQGRDHEEGRRVHLDTRGAVSKHSRQVALQRVPEHGQTCLWAVGQQAIFLGP